MKIINHVMWKRAKIKAIWGFDISYYRESYPDVVINGGDPYRHYLDYGWREGRDPSDYFSTNGYLAANPDVAANNINPLTHFLKYGILEGRIGWQKKYPERQHDLLGTELKKLHFEMRRIRRLLLLIENRKSNGCSVNYNNRTLYVDVSEFAFHDRRTGIQRVVKSILAELVQNPPNGIRVVPIFGQYDDHRFGYKVATNLNLNFTQCLRNKFKCEFIQPRSGDIFMGLDLAPTIVPKMFRDDIYSEWRACGVSIYFVVYDLLPITRPEFFQIGTEEQFSNWLTSVLQSADGVICISRTVARELKKHIVSSACPVINDLTIDWFNLASDKPPAVIPQEKNSINRMKDSKNLDKTYVLMVGTVEPRKGHMQMLDAFNTLWEKGIGICLVIIGRKGWLADEIISRVVSHPLFDKNLFWYSDVDDIDLENYYHHSTGLVAASIAEGYGLPLVEAARRNIPIFARDIHVFREIAGPHATYFDESGEFLVLELEIWLDALLKNTAVRSGGMPVLTWAQSAAQLMAAVFGPKNRL